MEKEVAPKPRHAAKHIIRSLAYVATSCLALPASAPGNEHSEPPQSIQTHSKTKNHPTEPLIHTVLPVTIYKGSDRAEPYYVGTEVFVFCTNPGGLSRLLPVDGGQIGYGELSQLDVLTVPVQRCEPDGSVPF